MECVEHGFSKKLRVVLVFVLGDDRSWSSGEGEEEKVQGFSFYEITRENLCRSLSIQLSCLIAATKEDETNPQWHHRRV